MSDETNLTVSAKSQRIRQYLELREGQISAAMCDVAKQAFRAKDLINLVLTGCGRDSKLLDCTYKSLLRAAIQAAESALPPTGRSGLAYLVPFQNGRTGELEAVFVPGYPGIQLNMVRSGTATKVEARVVYEGDTFDFAYGDHPHVTHTPAQDCEGILSPEEEWQAIRAAYAIAWLPDGQTQFTVLTKADLTRIKNFSRGRRDDAPWKSWPSRQSRKSAIRRLGKEIVVDPSTLLAKTLAIDEGEETSGLVEGMVESVIDVEPTEPTGTEELKARLGVQEAATTERPVETPPRPDGGPPPLMAPPALTAQPLPRKRGRPRKMPPVTVADDELPDVAVKAAPPVVVVSIARDDQKVGPDPAFVGAWTVQTGDERMMVYQNQATDEIACACQEALKSPDGDCVHVRAVMSQLEGENND